MTTPALPVLLAVAVAAVACSEGAAPPRAGCGSYVLDHVTQVPQPALDCLAEALRDRRPLSLRVTRPTIEGDPVPTTYTPLPDGRIEIVSDTSKDRYGSGDRHVLLCAAGPVTRELRFEPCVEP